MSRQSINPDTHKSAMEAAIRRLQQENIHFEVLTAFHIKVGDLNFYPGRGTIYCDGERRALPKSGLDAFVDCARPYKRTEESVHSLIIPE